MHNYVLWVSDCCLSLTQQIFIGYKIGICCFSATHTALRRYGKYWLARNQDNVSEWRDMSIHGLLFQWVNTTKVLQASTLTITRSMRFSIIRSSILILHFVSSILDKTSTCYFNVFTSVSMYSFIINFLDSRCMLFSPVLQYHPPIKLTATIWLK
jgi:hypothetical protein